MDSILDCKRLLESSKDVGNFNFQMSTVDFGKESALLFRVIDDIYHGKTGLNKPIDFIRGSVSNLKIKSQKLNHLRRPY